MHFAIGCCAWLVCIQTHTHTDTQMFHNTYGPLQMHAKAPTEILRHHDIHTHFIYTHVHSRTPTHGADSIHISPRSNSQFPFPESFPPKCPTPPLTLADPTDIRRSMQLITMATAPLVIIGKGNLKDRSVDWQFLSAGAS